MVSKESEYLIHLAEKQLDRLNNSLYFYQRNAEIQEDLLEYSMDEYSVAPRDISLSPIYAIIDRQRIEMHSHGASRSSADPSLQRKESKYVNVTSSHTDSNDNNIRAWRTGIKLAHQTLGPNKQSSLKCHFTETPPSNASKKEKMSTFWDYNGHKISGRISKSVEEIQRSDNSMGKCCNRKDSYSRNEIRKYIRDKQRLYKEKRFESNTKSKHQRTGVNASSSKLCGYTDHKVIELDDFDEVGARSRKFRTVRGSKSTTVYDELRREGVLDHRESKKTNYHQPIQTPLRIKNGINNTTDSGIETGDWIQGIPSTDTLQLSVNDQIYLQIPSSSPVKLPGESTRRQDASHILSQTKKSKSGCSVNVKKQYHDHISAYDASSENDLGNDTAFCQLTPSQSPISSHENDEMLQSHYLQSAKVELNISETNFTPNDNIRTMMKSDGKLSISMPNCNVDFPYESTINRSQGDLRSTTPSQNYLADELKQALFDAQMQLNTELCGPNDTLSERISQAVYNFLKTKEQTSGSVDAGNGDQQQPNITDNYKLTYRKSEKIKCKNERRKEPLSTECEATEIEHENGKHISKISENDQSSVVKRQIEDQISEEKSLISIDSDKSEVIDEGLKENIAATIETRKKKLQLRKEKAYELIKLTHEFKKESKKVKLLEKKACQISKQYFLDSQIDKTNGESLEHSKHPLKLIGLATLPRHVIPPDGKDCARLESKETEHRLSSKMTDMGLEGESASREDHLTPDISRQINVALSDVDEPTVSISDVSTSLTDQSELEARLVALKTEMAKKHQLVALLKSRQKEMKRDKIKQKEIILQKQIDMYDAYISKLQSNIDEISNRANDVESDESHTLTASITNVNDLESKVEDLDADLPRESNEDSSKTEADELDIDDIYKKSCDDSQQLNNVSLDEIVANNITIAGENVDLDFLHDPFKQQDLLLIDLTEPLPKLDTIEISKDVIPNDLEDHDHCHVMVDDLLTTSNREDDHFDELIRKNDLHDDGFSEHSLNEMYIKESKVIDKNCEDTSNLLDDLLSRNLNCESVGENLSVYEGQDIPKLQEDNTKIEFEADEKKKDENSERHQEEREDVQPQDRSFGLNEGVTEHSFEDSLESDLIVQKGLDDCLLNLSTIQQVEEKTDLDDGNLRFATAFSDDDESSVSDAKSIKLMEEDLPEDVLLNEQVTPIMHSADDVQDVQPDVMGVSSTVDPGVVVVSVSDPIVEADADQNVPQELLNSAQIEELVECILNAIVFSEIEQMKHQTAQMDLQERMVLSVAVKDDLQSTSFIENPLSEFPPPSNEVLQSQVVSKSEDLWEFTDVTVEEPSEVLKVHSSTQNSSEKEEESVEKTLEAISIIDKQLLSEKIKWFIPLKQDKLDSYINSAILHFFQARQGSQSPVEDLLTEASEILPEFYTDPMSVVTDPEVGDALLDPSKQNCFIDKRIIFQLVKEIFSEIYSFERYLPQMPWIHSSFMIKRKNYTTWKGDKPPESYDLVSKIIRERICQLLNQKNILLESGTPKSTESASHSKITKWCIERQKDHVDRLLINDLRKEENEWVYYDEAEEEVKIQIAEDVFNFLITDTICWLKSTLSQN